MACASVSTLQPDIIVLDEPSSNLDFVTIQALHKALHIWKQQGRTIIIAEHRLYYLMGLADRFLYLQNGEVHKDFSAA